MNIAPAQFLGESATAAGANASVNLAAITGAPLTALLAGSVDVKAPTGPQLVITATVVGASLTLATPAWVRFEVSTDGTTFTRVGQPAPFTIAAGGATATAGATVPVSSIVSLNGAPVTHVRAVLGDTVNAAFGGTVNRVVVVGRIEYI